MSNENTYIDGQQSSKRSASSNHLSTMNTDAISVTQMSVVLHRSMFASPVSLSGLYRLYTEFS